MDYILILFRLTFLAVSFPGVLLTQDPYVYYFGGTQEISYDVPDGQHSELLPLNISYKAWPEVPEGVLFYSHAEQGYTVLMDMYEGHLTTRLSFDKPQSNTYIRTSASGFGLHEDEEWKNVSLTVNSKGFSFELNQASSLSPNPTVVRLGKKLYIGGFGDETSGLKSKMRFRGCMEDFTVNGVNVFKEKWMAENPSNPDGRPRPCPLITSYLTFTGLDSYLKISNTDLGSGVLDTISFEFRTFDKDATLLLLDLGAANISVEFTNNNTILLRMSSFGFEFNNKHPVGFDIGDGEYHRLEVGMNATGLSVTLDKFNTYDTDMKPPRDADIQAYLMAGFPGTVGYKGCVRELRLNDNRFRVRSLAEENVRNVLFGRCELIDRCYATGRRCSNGGKCLRSRDDFQCNCSGTGYGGMGCHTPLYPETCDLVTFPPNSNEVTAIIDVDGAGPLRPAEVLCSKDLDTGVIMTVVQSNSSQTPTRVDGYQEPGSYRGQITYTMELPEAIGIVNRAESCQQLTKYSCTNSTLMASQEGSSLPYGWWLDRRNKKQYYWGGAVRASRKCACSLNQGGCLGGLGCNCDAGENFEVTDQGYLRNKTLLPVTEVRFGDTGTPGDNKFADYTVGDVECTGDAFLQKSVTIHQLGASIDLDRYAYYWQTPIDIRFQFKTTIGKAQLLHAEGKRDFISILLEDPYTVSVRMSVSGEELYNKISMVSKLNDDQWHTVYFERTFKETVFIVDQSAPKRLHLTTRWWFHNTINVDKSLILGGNSNGTFGFVGCFRGLVIKGTQRDLQALVEDETKGVLKGCQARCSRMSSCQNGGLCTEYYATYMCDCEKTAFSGCYCGNAIGVRFQLGSWMMFSIQERTPSPLTYFQLYFKSTKSQGVLANINNFQGQNLVRIEINLRGGVDVTYDSGNGQRGLFTSVDGLTDGTAHRITVRVISQQQGNSWDVEFDNVVQSADGGPITNSPGPLYLASEGAVAGGFDGCIFGVMYNNVPLLKEVKITPFWVSFDPNQVHLDENDCGETEYSIKNTMLTPFDIHNAGPYRLPVTITRFGSASMNQTRVPIVASYLTDLVCEARGFPKVSYIIKQNGGVANCPHLLDQGRILLPPDSRIHGSYQCLATNQWGKSISEFLNVETPRLADVSSVVEDSMFLREGQYLRLRCNVSVDSVPEANTIWTGIDMQDNTADRFYQGVDGDLHFLWVLPEDSKEFTCYKVNPVLMSRVEVKRIRLQVNPVTNSTEYTSKPLETVYSSSPQMSANIGEVATLECLVLKHPTPNVTWSVKGSNRSLTSMSQLRGRRLVISDFTESDSGEYQCMVEDNAMVTIMLNQTLKPTWMVNTKSLTVYEGGDVEISCTTRRLPDWALAKTEWYINREPFQVKPSYNLSEAGDKLTVTKASKLDDVFTYQCKAFNQYGSAFHEGYVNVISATTVSPPSDQFATKFNRLLVFSVSATADPSSNLTFNWYHGDNQTAISADGVYKVTFDKTTSRLNIDLERVGTDITEYTGVYRCVVTDGAENHTVSARLQQQIENTPGGPTGSSTNLQGNLSLLVVTCLLWIITSYRQLDQGRATQT